MRPRPHRVLIGPWVVVFLVLSLSFAVSLAAQENEGRKASADVYIVQMSDAPVVAYDGGIDGLKATRPAKGRKLSPLDPDVIRYAGYLDAKHSEVAAKARANKVYDYRYAFNGFAARLTESDVAIIKADPRVVSVEKTVEYVMDTATTPSFLGLTTPGSGLWSQNIKGENVIIGIVDSGVWPESASFSDRTGTGPNGQEGKLAYQQIPGWHGKCVPGESFNASHCNQKLIGAQYFCEARGCENVPTHEFLSPRDFNGHGTHTASTAGGNEGVRTTGAASVFGTVSGIAPRARVAAYKTCWDNGAGGCGSNSGDAVAAIDQAVIDGVDVINYSISGTTTNYLDSVEVAYLFAADAGVFVATSAGNSGPTASTVAHISPWLAAVAAGVHDRSGSATITLGNGAVYNGASMTPGVGPANLVLASESGVAGAHPDLVRQCFSSDPITGTTEAPNPNFGKPVLDAAKIAGKIVVCERGGTNPAGVAANARVDKSAAVRNGGGVGMILYNVASNSINADLHSLPTVHIDHVNGPLVRAYAQTVASTAALSTATIFRTGALPDTASFSSRGPSRAGLGDILKPDFMLPGQDILAAVAPPGNGGKDFDLYSGTSMSSPHVAGVAALLTEKHPDWSPAAMRSAMATTASPALLATYSPFNAGAGQVQPNRMIDPGLVYDAGFNDYLAFLRGQGLVAGPGGIDASDLNQPSIAIGDLAGVQTVTRRLTNVSGSRETYTATVAGPAGYTISVNPSSFEINPGESKTFTVSFTRTDAPLNTYRFGSLTWNSASHSVRSPLVIRPVAIAAPAEVAGAGADGALSYGIKTGYTGALSYVKRGLVRATETPGSVTDDPTDDFNTAEPDGNQGITKHEISVPAGVATLRVSLFNANVDGPHDLDLYLYRIDPTALVLVGTSGGGSSAEQIQITPAAAGATYRVYVHGWQTAGGGTANYTLFSWQLGTSDAGNMTVTGPPATTGGSGTVNVSWTGLSAGKYFGQIRYTEGSTLHGTTLVRVDVP